MALPALPDDVQFSGHETFPLRQLWLRKAYEAAQHPDFLAMPSWRLRRKTAFAVSG
ncbi:DUF4007 family protein [Xanthomonas populi]